MIPLQRGAPERPASRELILAPDTRSLAQRHRRTLRGLIAPVVVLTSGCATIDRSPAWQSDEGGEYWTDGRVHFGYSWGMDDGAAALSPGEHRCRLRVGSEPAIVNSGSSHALDNAAPRARRQFGGANASAVAFVFFLSPSAAIAPLHELADGAPRNGGTSWRRACPEPVLRGADRRCSRPRRSRANESRTHHWRSASVRAAPGSHAGVAGTMPAGR